MSSFPTSHWGLILGGSSGFGLATAKKLAANGLNLVIVHRDRRGAMKRIEPEFQALRDAGVRVVAINADALADEGREQVLQTMRTEMGESDRVRVVLHSIAFGNLKPLIAPTPTFDRDAAIGRLASELGLDPELVSTGIDRAFEDGVPALYPMASPTDYGERLTDEEDLASTIYNMGTSLETWVRELHERGLFAADARVLGLTSEGNEIAWRGYAAVSAAKVAMESISRSIALEFAPYGIRSNIVQAGITETPASALIPGIGRMKAQAQLRNPFGRLTTPADVADFLYLLCTDEAGWVNGAVLRVDGGEHISGGAY